MKKSLDPLKAGFAALEARGLGQQITDFTQAILCFSEEAVIQLIADLKTLKTSLEANEQISTAPELEKFQEFYNDAADYFNEDYDEDCVQTLRKMILKGIQDFCELLEKEDAAARSKRIQDSIEINEKKIAARKANQAILARKQIVTEARISGEDVDKYEKLNIHTKIKRDADLCMNARNLIERIDQLSSAIESVRSMESKDEPEKMNKLAIIELQRKANQKNLEDIVAECIKLLAVIQIDCSDELDDPDESSLIVMKNKLACVFDLFYYATISVTEFLGFDQETRLFFIEDPDAILKVARAEESKKLLAIKLAKKLHEDRKSGVDTDELLPTYVRLMTLKAIIIEHNLPIELLDQWDDEFLFELTNIINSEEIEVFSDVLAKYNSKLSPEELANGHSVHMAEVFKFSNENILTILKSGKIFKPFIMQTDVTIKEILALDNDRIAYWLSKQENFWTLARFKVLLNYFMLPKEILLSASIEKLKELIDKPQIIVPLFDSKCRSYTNAELKQCFAAFVARSKERLDALNSNGFLINLSKLKKTARSIIADLQNIGLNFYQCRAVYDMMILVKRNFAVSYVNALAPTSLESFRPQYVIALRAWFSEQEIDTICSVVNPYITALEETLNRRTMHLPTKFSFIKDMVEDVDNIDVAELVTVLEQRVRLDSLTDGTISSEHLDLYRYLVDILGDKYPDLYPNEDCVLGRLNDKFNKYKLFPINDLGNTSNRDEDKLFAAIYDHDDKKIAKLLEDDNVPVGYNSKDTSYLASAALEASIEIEYVGIHDIVKKKVAALTEFKLNSFLFANNIANKSRAYQLAFAISLGEGYIVQALVARCTSASLNARIKEFDNKTALELARNSLRPNRIAIINEILAALALEHKKVVAQVEATLAPEHAAAAVAIPRITVNS